jgi:hypothetical protein
MDVGGSSSGLRFSWLSTQTSSPSSDMCVKTVYPSELLNLTDPQEY